jgi:BASS family bile acid:Na+ symporter
MDRLINVLVTITLVEMMGAIGLGVTARDIAVVASSWRLITRAAVANYVCIPIIVVGLLYLVNPHPTVAAGFLIVAFCPGAPYGPPLTAIAKGNVAVAVGLMVLLAGSSAFIGPFFLRGLLPFVSRDDQFAIDTVRIVSTLFLTQLLPLCIGIAVRHWRPGAAARMTVPAIYVSKFLNLTVVGLILLVHFDLLVAIGPVGFVAMIGLLISSWATGWLLGGQNPDMRKAMAVTTSLRNFGVGLVIATGTFPGTPAVTAVVAYGLVSLLGTVAIATFTGFP